MLKFVHWTFESTVDRPHTRFPRETKDPCPLDSDHRNVRLQSSSGVDGQVKRAFIY